ncbi:MAG: transposase, partial [Clostridia bacterium]|nr:transposase [Clostridia bacterium]
MKFPIRKDIRLKDFDYSQDGIYFITICSENRKNIFSKIKIKQDLESATVELTEIGLIAEKHIGLLEQRYNFIEIIAHTIMPNHIHLLISVL